MAELPAGVASIETREEFARALTALREQRGLTVREVAAAADAPVATVGGYLSGRHLPPLAAMDQLLRVLAALGVRGDDVDAWVDAVSRLRRAPGRRPADSPSPYLGLAAYEAEDAALFVGREAITESLVARVTQAPPQPVVVIGPSGSGKSSLLRAGLVAALRDAGREVLVTTPTGSDGAASAVGAGAVLVVDQLEEVLGDDLAAARVLLADLDAAHRRGVAVVVALRADFFDRALAVDPLPAWLEGGPVLVPALTADELRRVVVEPARTVGVDVEDALVDVLVSEAGAAAGRDLESGALPLVSHALYVTWAASSGHRLTLDHYREAGGFEGAVAKTAERMFAGLSAEQQAVAHGTLLRLVHVRDGAPDTRRPADQREFTSDAAHEVLDACIAARLVTSDRGRVQLAHEALIAAWPRLRRWLEENREALRVQGRLTEAVAHWLASDRSRDLLYRGSALDALEEVVGADDAASLTEPEREFLEASRAAERLRRDTRRRAARRLRVLAAALAVVAVAAVGFAVAAWRQTGVLANERDLAISRQLAVTSRSLTATDPELAGQVALAATSTAETVEARSALLSASGMSHVSRLAVAGGVVNRIAVSPDGASVAVATEVPDVQLWTTGARPTKLATLPTGGTALYAATFSPDGTILVAGGGDRRLLAWDVSDPARPQPVAVAEPDVGGTVYDLAFDGSGDLIAAAVSDGTVHLWRRDGTAVTSVASLTVFAGTAQSAVFVGDTLAVAGSEGLLALVDVSDPAAPALLGTPVAAADGQISSLALSPDGHTLAAGSQDFTVHLWDVGDPSAPAAGAVLTGPASWVNGIAFSPDGSTLAAADSDKHLWTWDVATATVRSSLPEPALLIAAAWAADQSEIYVAGIDGAVWAWPFPGSTIDGLGGVPAQAPVDGDTLVTATRDGMRVWDVSDPEEPRLLSLSTIPEGDRLDGAVDVSLTSGLVVAGTRGGAAYVWDITDRSAPRLLGSVSAHDTWIETVDLDPTGTRVALSCDDGTISLWDLSAGVPAAPTSVITDAGGMVYTAYFSPDGGMLVAAVLTAGTVRLYDVSDLAHPAPIGAPLTGPEGYVYAAVFSPDGRMVAAAGADGTIWLWDISTPTAPAEIGTPLVWAEGFARGLAFSPDGTRLAAAMGDSTIRIWDVSDPASPTRWASLSGTEGTLYGLAFWPDGTHVNAEAADRTVRVYDTSESAAAEEICAAADRGVPMTRVEWARVAGDLPFPESCAERQSLGSS